MSFSPACSHARENMFEIMIMAGGAVAMLAMCGCRSAGWNGPQHQQDGRFPANTQARPTQAHNLRHLQHALTSSAPRLRQERTTIQADAATGMLPTDATAAISSAKDCACEALEGASVLALDVRPERLWMKSGLTRRRIRWGQLDDESDEAMDTVEVDMEVGDEV